eukprot:UN16661
MFCRSGRNNNFNHIIINKKLIYSPSINQLHKND